MLVDSPTELALQPGEFPVVTFLVFNQYLGILDIIFPTLLTTCHLFHLPPAPLLTVPPATCSFYTP